MVKEVFQIPLLSQRVKSVHQLSLLLILMLVLIAYKSKAQISEEDLLGTWFPVMEQYEDGDTSSFLTYSSIYKFSEGNKGIIEDTGLNIEPIQFAYQVISDSIFMRFIDKESKDGNPQSRTAKVLSVDENHLKLSLSGPIRTVFFVPIPEYGLAESIQDVKSTLFDETWEFETDLEGYGEPYEVLYHFKYETDSSLVSEKYQSSIHLVETHQKFFHGNDPLFWSVGKHDDAMILRVNDVFSDFQSFIYIIKEVSTDKMQLVVWKRGKAHAVTAKRQSPLSDKRTRKIHSKLTRTKWQFRSEKIPPPIDTTGLIILDMVLDDFERLPPYKHDSTSIIRQADLDEKLLHLEFRPNGTYYIYRNERVLDKGTWTPIFNFTQLKLTSSRDRNLGDGIYGGIIEIESLRKRQFKLRRRLEQRSRISGTSDHSHLETYRPYRKRH